MTFIDNVTAVALTEASEHGRMARSEAFFGKKAAVMAQLIYYDIFLCAEKGIEGLARYLSFTAQVAYAYIIERLFFKKSQKCLGNKLL